MFNFLRPGSFRKAGPGTRNGKPVENRSKYYLVDSFNSLCAGKLAKLPAWSEWTRAVLNISPLGQAAFSGEENLHERQKQIEAVWQIYEKLRQEARRSKVLRSN